MEITDTYRRIATDENLISKDRLNTLGRRIYNHYVINMRYQRKSEQIGRANFFFCTVYLCDLFLVHFTLQILTEIVMSGVHHTLKPSVFFCNYYELSSCILYVFG